MSNLPRRMKNCKVQVHGTSLWGSRQIGRVEELKNRLAGLVGLRFQQPDDILELLHALPAFEQTRAVSAEDQATFTEFPVSRDVMSDKGGSVCTFEIPTELADATEYFAARFGAAKTGAGIGKFKNHARNFSRMSF